MLFFIPIFSSLYKLIHMDMERRSAKVKRDADSEPKETSEDSIEAETQANPETAVKNKE